MNTDPFDTLGIEPSFTLDRAELDRKQRELSKALHPDRYAGSPAGERRQALSRAIDVNEAYRALKDPVRRGEALLMRLGQPLSETEQPADPMFLMEIMELREALSEAGRKQDEASISALAARVSQLQRSAEANLARQFELALQGSEAAHAAHAPRTELSHALGQLRYYKRFLEEAHALLDELD